MQTTGIIERLRDMATDPRRDIQPAVRQALSDGADMIALLVIENANLRNPHLVLGDQRVAVSLGKGPENTSGN